MAVYVDQLRIPYRNMIMCHMLADTPEELHQMALQIGMRTEWYQPLSSPHYDVCLMRKKKALDFGAIEIDRRTTVKIIRRIRLASQVDWSPESLNRMTLHGHWR